MSKDHVPEGYEKLAATEVFINRSTGRIAICGVPEQDTEEEFEHSHNCDRMGCGSFDHVIVWGKIDVLGL